MKIIKQKKIEIDVTNEGKPPFVDWLESLDEMVKYRIKERLDRVSLGNLGDYTSIEQGVNELRLAFGSGYRFYYAEEGDKIIFLLCGGDKSSQ